MPKYCLRVVIMLLYCC